eukprot:767577-Hanusia_phi.AAC.1
MRIVSLILLTLFATSSSSAPCTLTDSLVSLEQANLVFNWSSELIVFNNNVHINRSYANGVDVKYNISYVSDNVNFFDSFATLPAVNGNGDMQFKLSRERIGGNFQFIISASVASDSSACTTQETSFNVTIFTAFADARLNVTCLPNSSSCELQDFPNMFSAQFPRYMTNGNIYQVEAGLFSWRQWHFTGREALAVSESLNTTIYVGEAYISQIISSGAIFYDALPQNKIVFIPSLEVSAEQTTYESSTIIQEVLCTYLPVNASGKPEFFFPVESSEVLRYRQYEMDGKFKNWVTDPSPPESLILRYNNHSWLDDRYKLWFEIPTNASGEVEILIKIKVIDVEVDGEFLVKILPILQPPEFSLFPETLYVDRNSGPVLIKLNVTSRGGWFGTSMLPLLPPQIKLKDDLVQTAVGHVACNDGGPCVELVFYPDRYGMEEITVTLQNVGFNFTSLGQDSSSVNTTIHVRFKNIVPSFEVESDILVLNEDSSCTDGQISSDFKPIHCRNEINDLRFEFPNFASQITMGLYDDLGLGCPSNDAWKYMHCNNQTGSFNVNSSESLELLFEEFPTISSDGNLTFKLAANQSGEIRLNISLTDDDPVMPLTYTRILSMIVLPVNDPPQFELMPMLTIQENASAQVFHSFAFNITPGCLECIDEFTQLVSFEVRFDVEASFFVDGKQPAVIVEPHAKSGTLKFEVQKSVFGLVHLSVRAVDNGKRLRGGSDTSLWQTSTLQVLQVNFPPTFSIIESPIFTRENAGVLSTRRIISSISAGAPNENCGHQEGLYCKQQNLTFEIMYIEQSDLFFRLPEIDMHGNITFSVIPSIQGVSRVFFKLVDDGQMNPVDAAIGNQTAVHVFSIVVLPTEGRPDYSLSPRISCKNLSSSMNVVCFCPTVISGTNCSELLATNQFSVDPEPDVTLVSDFVGRVTNARGFLPASQSTFLYNATSGNLELLNYSTNPFLSQGGLEYVTKYAFLGDKSYLFAIEPETDSLTIFKNDNGVLNVFDRKIDQVHTLLFRGFSPTQEFDRTPLHFETMNLFRAKFFQESDRTYLVASGGGELPRNLIEWTTSDVRL